MAPSLLRRTRGIVVRTTGSVLATCFDAVPVLPGSWIRINDRDVSDNDGELRIRIAVY